MRANKSRQRYLAKLRLVETPNTKLCSRCEEILPLKSFWKSRNKEARKGRATYCCKCMKEYEAKRYEEGKTRNGRLERLYGITLEQYDKMLEEQSNCCALCGSSSPKRGSRFIVDHCHKTGNVRALLCHLCNIFIGMAGDNPNLLRKAADYLESYNG